MKRLLFAALLYAFMLGGWEPFAVYTLLEDPPDERMAVQWVSTESHKKDALFFREKGASQWYELEASINPIPGVYGNYVSRAVLTGLKPDTTYEFKLKRGDELYSFRTLPNGLTRPIAFVVGGDIYHDTIDIVSKMNLMSARLNPDFILLGGDIAYTNSRFSFFSDKFMEWTQNLLSKFNMKLNKRERWLDWIRSYSEDMIDSQGNKIPFFATIGNHDVDGGFDQTKEQAQAFYALLVGDSPTVYRKLDFDKELTIIALDSGHTAPIGGTQTLWLYNTLRERRDFPNKLVFYHTPAFPSCRDPHYKPGTLIRRHWVPFFDAFGVDMVFEHHDHAYKRTIPLRGGKEDPKGVLYIGDGAWGIKSPRRPKKHRPYLAKAEQARNVIYVKVSKEGIHFTAYDDDGKVLDSN